jgi:hypothetical protein
MESNRQRINRKISSAAFSALSSMSLLNWMPDKLYLSAMWRAHFGKKLDWKNPRSFNEKLQWLKAYDHNPAYPRLVDKETVRRYVSDTIGPEYLIPLVGGPWKRFDEIDFDLLPESFVLKCTHDSGGVVICRDKKALDLRAVKKKIEKSLRRNYYWGGREWPYKNVKPRVIAERYMGNETGDEVKDYKFMMFGGEHRCAFVCSNRFAGSKLNVTFFDPGWNRMPFERHYRADARELPRPERYEEMIRLSERLSAGMPFVRIDLYEISGRVYFGEITLYPGSGLEEFEPVGWDYALGEWIDLKRFFPKEF